MRNRSFLFAAAVLGLACAVCLTACGKPAPIPRVATPTAGPPLTAVTGAAPVWAVGWTELVLDSTDGGATWSTKHQGAKPLSMLFGVAVHGRQVFAAGQHIICSSGDGGATWSRFTTPDGCHLREVACSDARHAWAVGDRSSNGEYHAVVFATADGGRTWTQQSVPGVAGLASVSFVDAHHGWAVGGDISKPVGDVVVTSDGGAHWRLQERVHGTDLHGVTFVDQRHGWAVGTSRGIILATSDGGAHWAAQQPPQKGLLDVAFIDVRRGWAVGQDGLILATSDGGKHWSDQSVPQHFQVRRVAFANAQVGWAVFGSAHLLATRDGGRSWSVISPLRDYTLLGDVACQPRRSSPSSRASSLASADVSSLTETVAASMTSSPTDSRTRFDHALTPGPNRLTESRPWSVEINSFARRWAGFGRYSHSPSSTSRSAVL
jgi:photosystem II stability/assembly factor-like uncharacterized protein